MSNQTPWYKTLIGYIADFFRGTIRILYEIAMPAVKEAVTDILNNRDLQASALVAVQAAASGGLRGNNAWDVARIAFVRSLKDAGSEASATIVDTMLQNAYCAAKYATNSLLEQTPTL